MFALGAFLVGFRQAGQLDQNAVAARRLDDRLGHAELVHALAQHLHRLRQRAADIRGVGTTLIGSSLRLGETFVSISTRNDVPPCKSRPSLILPEASR